MLTLLHTSPVHVATFDALRDRIAPGTQLCHIVREDLLKRARTAGITPEIEAATAALIHAASGATLCTCTTLGEVAETAGALRIDRSLMQAAAEAGGKVLLAYCLDSTAQTSHALLAEEMAKAGNPAGATPLSLASAWPRFEAGDLDAFVKAIAQGIRNAITDDTGCIVLAQASMALRAALSARPRPLPHRRKVSAARMSSASACGSVTAPASNNTPRLPSNRLRSFRPIYVPRSR